MEEIMNREKHRQQVEVLRHQNKITEERIAEMKETERKLKQIILDWRKTENKEEVIKNIHNLLFKKKEHVVVNKLAKKIDAKYKEVKAEVTVGAKVKMKKNHQVGEVKEIRGKRAIVQIGLLPMNVEMADLVVVEEKQEA
jgi:DNA mismatch repair protein MutS2